MNIMNLAFWPKITSKLALPNHNALESGECIHEAAAGFQTLRLFYLRQTLPYMLHCYIHEWCWTILGHVNGVNFYNAVHRLCTVII